MAFLLLHIAFNCAFLQIVRLGQVRREHAMAAGAINYVVAAACGLAYFATRYAMGHLADQSAGDWWLATSLGAANGVLFAVHLLIVLAAYAAAGVGITVAVTHSGIVVPVLVSWLVWAEPMTPARWVAVALVPVAMFLMRPARSPIRHLNLKADLILLASLAAAGTVGVIHKAQQQYVEPLQPAYHMALFIAAAVFSIAYVLAKGLRVQRGDAAVGVPLGAVNAANLFWLLMALAVVPATQVFPIAATATIAGSLLLSRLFWKESITWRQALGIVVAMVIVVLVNV